MGNLASGYIDEDAAGIVVSDSLTGTYSVDSSGTGRVTTPSTAFGTSSSAPPTLFFCLTGAGSPAPVLDLDASGLGAGIAHPQNTGRCLSTGRTA
jgi:hypothetical protein